MLQKSRSKELRIKVIHQILGKMNLDMSKLSVLYQHCLQNPHGTCLPKGCISIWEKIATIEDSLLSKKLFETKNGLMQATQDTQDAIDKLQGSFYCFPSI